MQQRAKANRKGKASRRREGGRNRRRGLRGLWGLADEEYDRASSGIGERFPESNIQSKVEPLAKPGLPSASPGANASTFFGRAACQRMLRLILKGRCRLSGFARSFAALRNAPSTSKETSTAAIFPMPLPYPEVFQRGSRGGSPFDRARKKFVVCLVLILNYLHFRRPRSAVWAVCATTKTHWQTVGSGAPLGVSV